MKANDVTYLEAIRLAMGDILEERPESFLYGQDVEDPFGGAFKASKGLSTRFPGRVRNAPINEDAMAGLVIGAALEGMRPILEYQFADFASIAFNQLVNSAGTTFWRMGKACPITVRFPCGSTQGAGPFHSQMPESWLSHHPGLVVVAPSTPADAYHMLRQAVAVDDPVMFCEHKLLYFHERGDVPAEAALPLGRSVVRRAGEACTIVAWSAMVHEALQAAERLQEVHGIDIEVLDVRCVRPLDSAGILDSLERTGRLVILSEDWPFGGVAAEIQALVAERGFELLDAPPKRLCSLDTPIPYHPALWSAHRVTTDRVVDAVIELLRF